MGAAGLMLIMLAATCTSQIEHRYEEPESTAREIARRLLNVNQTQLSSPRGPSRRLLDHTVTHNIEMVYLVADIIFSLTTILPAITFLPVLYTTKHKLKVRC